MNIQNINIKEIKPYDKNAKIHSKKQIQQVANSIKRFGWVQPLVVDKDNNLIIGHCRLLAAKLLDIKEAPALRVENLSEQEIQALRLADNKLNESEWDMGLVIDELKGLSEEMFDLTGFDKDLLIENDDKDDVVPESAPAVAKLGDIWQLGEHRLACIDSTDEESVARLMNNNKADMVFTDPPYNINYHGSGKNTSNVIEGDNVTSKEFDDFLDKTFKNYNIFTKAGSGNYVFHATRTQVAFEQAMEKNGYEIKQQLIWNKPMCSLGMGDYRSKHEPFFYAGKKDEKVQFYGDRTHGTVVDFQKSEQQLINWAKAQKRIESEGKTTVWTMRRDNVQEYIHPTQKPVELIVYAITNSSKADDIVLDLFGGSGSTLIACEKARRTCYMAELDPKYVDKIIKRWEDYTGNKAIKL